MTRFRKSPRLKHFDYVGPFAYSLTLVTRGRAAAFAERDVVDATLDCLGRSCARYGFFLHSYCFMPDHLHILLSGDDEAPLQDFVRHFKQLSGHRYKRKDGAQLWQISYYDHVLRGDEDLVTVARYIWDNPVRVGLVQDRSKYPFSGPKPIMEQA
jgi:putative transposase